jgi:thiamine biosynthesis protein ThiS
MSDGFVIANGRKTPAPLPCTLEEFLIAQKMPPRSVVVELNGQATAPSEFSDRKLVAGDRLEIVKIVAGGQRKCGRNIRTQPSARCRRASKANWFSARS